MGCSTSVAEPCGNEPTSESFYKEVVKHGCEKKGTFRDGALNGHGKVTWEGFVSEGIFRDGILVSGTTSTPYGDVEEGNFVIHEARLELNGKGRKHCSNGTIEEGVFENGALVSGKRTYRDGTVESV